MKRTNIMLDENLVAEGMKATGLTTQRALIDRALKELVLRNRRKRILRHAGKVHWDGDLEAMRALR